MIRKLLVLFLLFQATGFAQIGINTNTPDATLDVNGTVRVENLIDASGVAVSLTGISSANR